MAESASRTRLPSINLHSRNISTVSLDSDSSDSSPDREHEDDTDYFTTHGNDSQSTICPAISPKGYHGDHMDVDLDQMHRRTPIAKLPPELLIAIFTKLTSTTDLRSCMLVSYHWALYSVAILWHRPLCNKWPNLENVARTLADSRPSFPYPEMVKRLNLSAIADKVSDGTVQAFMKCKSIERLTLTSCTRLTDRGVAGLVDGSRRLQALDVTDLDALTDHTLQVVAQNCPRLQGLNITNCTNITDESLVDVAQSCPQLKRLKLNQVFKATDRSITAVARHCRSILEIDLAGCESITSASVTSLLSNLPYLRELRLAHCTEITDAAFTNLPPRAQFEALRILDLTACEQVRDDAIARIIPAAPRLRNLVLAKCRHITDQAVNAICKLTKNLHYIHLGHCTHLTDTAVIKLVKHCNRIRYIDLACCSRLTDASVRHLAQLPKLRRVGLVKCQNLTDISIIALAHGPVLFHAHGSKAPVPHAFVSLERVHLSYCVNLTLKGITALLHNCPRLTHLSLTGVQAFLREDLTRFCREAPPEFTGVQRDVFCVFSGDGVSRLREYLTRLAMEEAERESREALDESLLDPEDSPGADTMSEDGTIDGHDHSHDVVYGHGRHGHASVAGSRRRPRPRSLQNFPSQTVDMPLLSSTQMQQFGPWASERSFTPDELRSPHLNLMGPEHLRYEDVPRPMPGSPGPALAPGPELDMGSDFEDGYRPRNSTRRYTMTAAEMRPSLSNPGRGPYTNSSPHVLLSPDLDEARRLGLNSMLLPPGPRRPSGQRTSVATPPPPPPPPPPPHYPMAASGLQPYPPHGRHIRDYSLFDANHEAIMSTIPNSPGLSPRGPSPQVPPRSGRNWLAHSHTTMRRLSSSSSASSSPFPPTDLATRQARRHVSREGSRPREREHLSSAAGSREMHSHGLPPSRPTELPILPPDLMDAVMDLTATPPRSAGHLATDDSTEVDSDVNMT